MAKYISETLQTPVAYECDVLVAGGGIAGVSAAVAAARQGAKVILLEKQFLLGGLATAGLITIYLPLCDGKGHQVSFGLAEELFRLSIKYGHEAKYPSAWLEQQCKEGTAQDRQKQRFEVRFNAQLFAIAMEQLLKKEGVTILYGTAVCGVQVEKDKIASLIIENKSGRSAVKAKSVVDTTGDADICMMAGEATELFEGKNALAAWYYSAGEKGFDLNMLGVIDISDEENDGTMIKLIPKTFQGVDAMELSEMVQNAHDAILDDFRKKRMQDGTLLPTTFATIPQVRMTRRLSGKYTMTLQDERREFEDSIGIISNWKKRGPVYEIPFSALHGTKIKNLITAGRSISAQDSMWDVTRVIPACAVTGEAAGTAAAMTDDFEALDVAELQGRLEKAGVKLFIKSLEM